jgi:hypothetical protein
MQNNSTRNSFHKAVLADVFPKRLNRADSMLLFALLHTYQINLAGAVITDAPSVRAFAAITQRHCAECLAHLWRGTEDGRSRDSHWYHAWNSDWTYKRLDAHSGRELERFNEIKRILETQPMIDSLTPADN